MSLTVTSAISIRCRCRKEQCVLFELPPADAWDGDEPEQETTVKVECSHCHRPMFVTINAHAQMGTDK